MSWKNKMKHVLQYKESSVISKISNFAIISSKLSKLYNLPNNTLTKS